MAQTYPEKMETRRVEIARLKIDPFYDLSFPADPEQRQKQAQRFTELPLIIVNADYVILFGSDFYRLFRAKKIEAVNVLQANIPATEALFINFNFHKALFGLNLYEKLVFIQRIMPLAPIREIYRKTGLDININPELLEKLACLCGETFKNILIQDKINLKTALRICAAAEKDRPSLVSLFEQVSFTSSQAQQILEMLEEICFRDKIPVDAVFEKINLIDLLPLERPQKTIIDALFKLRYPLYTNEEQEWQREIKKLNLPPHIKVAHSPFFEHQQIQLHATLKNIGDLKKISKHLRESHKKKNEKD
jgi:hypothetical protein